ncbi:cohesin complex subunit SCC1 [Cryptococcus deuterogattii 99/473]|uniref:Cohesin complex subunit SCC1 n=1 Tax=Cryptococcus deuterogattii Ram5 TaxID=1296110 RepID=A0A0D0V815_9TREE|nr:cohesin complex subunit SCC1 [Cryptococcus deuterogattii LA55]KIR42674.1 cohesin complex subunit SCC1 [Cryptococcus deuterogattii Ram5]KIR95744.1 cohesin complex subunit SCC1 [Cryptococcus deuterogattii CBS 10090]KIS02240.1 cohesin complex subunit SCC1 [Cryptococcus deuterogattii 2001/935-1]KIY59354.1 cohesin complex subunit SCC1 [Cryptococcus deuterogattii 99/473]
MILNELIKSGPLAKIWLSAHQERKLSKTQAMGVDVGESVEAILTQDTALPLRSSGPLMLGVVRIYSRKVGYLFDDCKEARERISLAFRPGIVDLPEDQVRASHNAITISSRPDFDFNDWTWGPSNFLIPPQPSQAAVTTTVLPGAQEFGAFNFGVPRAPSIYGGSETATSRHGSHDELSSQLGSNEFSGIDLGLNLEGDETIEYGREVMTPISREGTAYAAERERSIRAGTFDVTGFGAEELPPMAPMDEYDVEMVERMEQFEPMDLGLDFERELERERRATTELLTPPPRTPPPESISDLTPRTAAQISALPAPPVKGVKKPRLVMPDHETELTQGLADRAAILGAEHFIPADVELLQLNEIVSDPTSHFLPTLKIGGENWTAVAPLGLAPELTELFAFPSNVLRKGRGLEEAEEDRLAKRARVEGEVEPEEQIRRAEEEVEVVRRHEFEIGYEPEAFAPAFGGDEGDYGIGQEMPMEPFGVSPPTFRVSRGPSLAPSRAESIAREAEYEGLEGEFTLAMFDTRSSRAAESQVSQVPSSPSRAEAQREGAPGKYTSMAMDLLRNELQAIEEEDKVVSFEKLAEKATKRAASTFFFELLSLGTRDCIRLEQPEAFGDIKIRGKDKLWPSSSQVASQLGSEV